MDLEKLESEADFVTKKTISQDPEIAKKYYETLNTYKLEAGWVFVSLSVLQPRQTFFMALQIEPKEIITFEEKLFELTDRLHVQTKDNGIQTIWYYMEFEIKPLKFPNQSPKDILKGPARSS